MQTEYALQIGWHELYFLNISSLCDRQNQNYWRIHKYLYSHANLLKIDKNGYGQGQ